MLCLSKSVLSKQISVYFRLNTKSLNEFIETEVKNGELQIKTEKGYNISTSRRNGILIIVPFESLNAVSLAGSGDVVTKNTIKANAFKANLAGSGDLTLDVESTKTLKAI